LYRPVPFADPSSSLQTKNPTNVVPDC